MRFLKILANRIDTVVIKPNFHLKQHNLSIQMTASEAPDPVMPKNLDSSSVKEGEKSGVARKMVAFCI